ncbi:MAG: pyridoxamine 5'-phosphate oxidase [Methylophilaceae bacterium]|nr:MAG: pyridoxamine 5'-phosphate oxidase [Methylophilaceae bacterium]
MNLNLEAQQFLFGAQKGVLSTHSIKFEGYPFGSVTPYVLNHQGMPVILISSIAEHTKNIIQNANVSLMVFNNEDDLQANARLTLLAKAEQTDKDNALMRARYLRYMPQAESYFSAHDFSFYTLHITHGRYIAGFGKMGWIEGDDFQIPTNPLFTEESAILDHMNQDHGENLIAYCQHYHQVDAQQVEMVGIDSLGFDVRTDPAQILRFNFEQTITNAQEARAALVAMAKTCRA